jgi:hypothetical protein
MDGFSIVEEPDATLVARTHAELLVPSFRPSQLMGLGELQADIRSGATSVVVDVDAAGSPVAALVIDNVPACRVSLVSYLAVHPSLRGRARGSVLCAEMVQHHIRHRPDTVVLGEIEHPQAHPADPVAGTDPVARIAFFERLGTLALVLPFFQPALGAGRPRIHGMILILTPTPLVRPDADGRVDLRGSLDCFLRSYLTTTEGGVDDRDPATAALFAALHRSATVPTVPLGQWAQVPVSAG